MVLFRLDRFVDLFPWIRGIDWSARFNIAPMQESVVIPNDGQDAMQLFRWGLVPHWAKDPAVGARMINARSETVAERPAFRQALVKRRCIVPADGFYEWRKNPNRRAKTPLFIRRRDGRPMGFAGLWETWHDAEDRTLRTFTILTTTPNEMMADIHDRMPVILPEDRWHDWLFAGERPADAWRGFFDPFPADELEAYEVSTRVNRVANDDPALLEPVPAAQAGEEAGLFG